MIGLSPPSAQAVEHFGAFSATLNYEESSNVPTDVKKGGTVKVSSRRYNVATQRLVYLITSVPELYFRGRTRATVNNFFVSFRS